MISDATIRANSGNFSLIAQTSNLSDHNQDYESAHAPMHNVVSCRTSVSETVDFVFLDVPTRARTFGRGTVRRRTVRRKKNVSCG